MAEATTIDAVMRTLADPTRRAVFERIVRSDEITVVELTRGSSVTQSAISLHLRSLKQAGLIAERLNALIERMQKRSETIQVCPTTIDRPGARR